MVHADWRLGQKEGSWFMLIGGWGRRRIQARLEAGL
jgi:hypothetical protein